MDGGGAADLGLCFGPFMGGFGFGWFVKTNKTAEGEYYFGLILSIKHYWKHKEFK